MCELLVLAFCKIKTRDSRSDTEMYRHQIENTCNISLKLLIDLVILNPITKYPLSFYFLNIIIDFCPFNLHHLVWTWLDILYVGGGLFSRMEFWTQEHIKMEGASGTGLMRLLHSCTQKRIWRWKTTLD